MIILYSIVRLTFYRCLFRHASLSSGRRHWLTGIDVFVCFHAAWTWGARWGHVLDFFLVSPIAPSAIISVFQNTITPEKEKENGRRMLNEWSSYERIRIEQTGHIRWVLHPNRLFDDLIVSIRMYRQKLCIEKMMGFNGPNACWVTSRNAIKRKINFEMIAYILAGRHNEVCVSVCQNVAIWGASKYFKENRKRDFVLFWFFSQNKKKPQQCQTCNIIFISARKGGRRFKIKYVHLRAFKFHSAQ